MTSSPDYVYHATNMERAFDIASEGLKPHRPWEFTDQETWPDGGTERRVYFSRDLGAIWAFAPEEGQPAALRVPVDTVVLRGDGTGDVFARKRVPAGAIEILHENSWLRLRDALLWK